jgi:hypothetical protein
MSVRNVLIIGVSIILFGCLSFFSKEGDLVRVVEDKATVMNCKLKGTVTGTSKIGLNEAHKSKMALKDLRNKAAVLGADTVLIVSTDSMFEGIVIKAVAYDCPDNE